METALIIIRMVYLLKDFQFSPDSLSLASSFQSFLKNDLFSLTPSLIK
jgi:hypothetical protein